MVQIHLIPFSPAFTERNFLIFLNLKRQDTGFQYLIKFGAKYNFLLEGDSACMLPSCCQELCSAAEDNIPILVIELWPGREAGKLEHCL